MPPKLKETKMFYDENVNTFFRRPCWSPDGNLVFLPCGVYLEPGNLKFLSLAVFPFHVDFT